MRTEGGSRVGRLAEVNRLIAEHEWELEKLYAERDRLMWELEEGDHSE